MPPALKYVDPNDPSRGYGSPGFKERQSRTEKYTQALDYFEGRQKPQLDFKSDEPNDNVVVNLVRTSIDRSIAFLFPQIPHMELDPRETEETPDEKWLRLAWEYNGGLGLLTKIGQAGSLSGQVYVRVLPPRPGIDAYPRIRVLEPSSTITYWQADDMDTIVWHEQMWTIGDSQFILDVINEGDHWELIQYVQKAGTGFDPVRAESWNRTPGPIITWQHFPLIGSFYGRSDVEPENIAHQNSVNLISSEMMRINRYHSSPKTIAIGVGNKDEVEETSIDGLWIIENENAKLQNLEMTSSLELATNMRDFLHDGYLAEQRVVILKGEVKDFQRVTNTGVRTVFMDTLAKNGVSRQAYHRGIQQTCTVLGKLINKDFVPEIVGRDPLPTDDKEAVSVADIEIKNSVVSRETVATERGRNWTDEKNKMREEAEFRAELSRIAMGPQLELEEENNNAQNTQTSG